MLCEGAQLVGESGKTYLAVSDLGQANVWTAVDSNDMSNIVVIKEPGADDTRPGWPKFQNEMVMHELLKSCEGVRKQVDRIPPTPEGGPPMLVLEIFETTLWKARTKRPLSGPEVKRVMKDALHGLSDVHARGQVYADLKMPNIMVDGFNVNAPSDPSHLSAKLGDLGIVMPPANGKVQPVSYRAPEVYFKGAITSKADIWSWGLIYCHLLEAQNRFSKTGLYDDLDTGSGTMPEREAAVKHAMSNDYEMQSDAYFRDSPLPPNDTWKNHGDQWEELRRRGLPEGEVDFLRWLMRADPRKRPSAEDILRTGWLDKDDQAVTVGFVPPVDADGRPSMEFDPRRSSAADVEAAQRSAEQVNNGPVEPQSFVAHDTAPTNSSGFGMSTTRPAVPSQVSMTAPVMGIAKTPSEVQNAIEESYGGRISYKRELSGVTAETPANKKAYTSLTDADNTVASNAADSSKVMNVDPLDHMQRPSPSVNGDVMPGDDNSASNTTSSASVPATSTQERPAIASRNTGTFLSYR